MYISHLRLRNFRCFKDVELSFDLDGGSLPWTMFVGDNASGKTALLRSIALGLCDETSAAGLLKESEEGYIRRGMSKAQIAIELRPTLRSETRYYIETTIEKITTKGGSYERVRQRTKPRQIEFPWKELFTCGYGAARGTIATGDIAGYSALNAVYNMFNYTEGLQNPELVLFRITSDSDKSQRFHELFTILKTVMLLPQSNQIELTSTGITIDGSWGPKMPLRDLADGYKSTFLWVTDLLGWALSHKPNLRRLSDVSGIVIVDELEQHLHPKWQQNILPKLREQFPKVQFITSTHSPLVASTVGQLDQRIDRDKLVVLEMQHDTSVAARPIEPMKGLWVDQVLASEAFLYVTGLDPDIERVLAEASALASKGERRTEQEEQRYISMKAAIGRALQPEGRTLIEREIAAESQQQIREEIDRLEQKMFEARQ